MEIKRFRTSSLYPLNLFECEVLIGENGDNGENKERTVYADIHVGKMVDGKAVLETPIPSVEYLEESNSCWIREIPLDEAYREKDGEDYYSYLPEEQRREILSKCVNLWNEILKYEDSYEWKTLEQGMQEEDCKEIRG